MIILAFPASIVAAVWFLPWGGSWWLLLLCLMALTVCLCWWKQAPSVSLSKVKPILCVLLVLAGTQWGLLAKQRFTSLSLESDRDYYLSGTVTDIPRQRFKQTQAQLKIECLGTTQGQCDIESGALPLWSRYVDVTGLTEAWDISPGQTWQLVVRHKSIKRNTGPGSFNVHQWLMSRHVVARMKIQGGSRPKLVSDSRFSVDRIRAVINRFFTELDSQYPDTELSPYPVLLALISGDRSLMTSQHWQLFNRTGTTHLMAISGLHIGLVAVFVMALFMPLLKRWTWFTHRYPASNGAALIALFVCGCYAAIAGFALPTQRALVMLAVYVLLKCIGKTRQLWFALAIAFLLVLLWDPVACLSIGFWLSYIAVYFILWVVGGGVVQIPRWQSWSIVQIGLFFALAPVLLWKLQSLSLVSPFTNIFAIPIVGFLMAPLILLWACLWGVLGDGADVLLNAATWITESLLYLLQLCSSWKYSLFQIGAHGWWTVPIAYVGVIWLCTAGMPGRVFSPILILPLLLPSQTDEGFYVIGGSSPKMLIHLPDTVLVLDKSRWPQLIPRWQQQWLDHWGIAIPEDTAVGSSGQYWQGGGLFLTEYSLERNVFGQKMAKSIGYLNLCQSDGVEYASVQFEIFSDSRYPHYCAVKIRRAGSRPWLIWPTQSIRVQNKLVLQSLFSGNEVVVLNPAKNEAVAPDLVALVSQHQGDILALKSLPSNVSAQAKQWGVRVEKLEEGEYYHIATGKPLELVKEVPK